MKLRPIAVGLIVACFSTPVSAGWKWKDLDPFNRNSKVRRAGRAIDPGRALGRLKNRVFTRMGSRIANELRETAESDGWTTTKCRAAGLTLAVPIIALKGGAICAATTAGEPISATTCTTALTASSAAIVEIACTQLCHDHHLRDCQ